VPTPGFPNADALDPDAELGIDPDSPVPPHLRPAAWLLVLAGSIVGAALRIWAEHVWPPPPGGWPWATFGINIIGSFVLGVVLEVLARIGDDRGWRQNVRMLVATGVCSTFTTYSAMALELAMLVRDDAVPVAVAYALTSVVAGIAAAWAGIAIARGAR
jgi:fluoride exporter